MNKEPNQHRKCVCVAFSCIQNTQSQHQLESNYLEHSFLSFETPSASPLHRPSTSATSERVLFIRTVDTISFFSRYFFPLSLSFSSLPLLPSSSSSSSSGSIVFSSFSVFARLTLSLLSPLIALVTVPDLHNHHDHHDHHSSYSFSSFAFRSLCHSLNHNRPNQVSSFVLATNRFHFRPLGFAYLEHR